MTDSINFLHHTEEGTLVELRGNTHMVEHRLCMRIADLQEILRIYNGMYRGRKGNKSHSKLAPISVPKTIDEHEQEECNT